MKFTLVHGFAASLVLHGMAGLPFVLHGWAAPLERPPVLVVDLQGLDGEVQQEEKTAQAEMDLGAAKANAAKPSETKPDEASKTRPDEPTPRHAPEAKQEAAAQAPTPEAPPQDVAPDGELPAPSQATPEQTAQAETTPTAAPPPATAQTTAVPGASSTANLEASQTAETIKQDRKQEDDRRREYVKKLTSKVKNGLVYPDNDRRAEGSPKVSFTVLQNGQIRPDSLKVVISSGKPKLDASALKTIRSIAPFDPPPREMTVTFTVDYIH
jgi:periplasmic protein TonB